MGNDRIRKHSRLAPIAGPELGVIEPGRPQSHGEAIAALSSLCDRRLRPIAIVRQLRAR